MLLKIEHKKNCDISIGTFFNTVTTSMLSKLSPLFAIQRRPVYLFEHNNGRIVLWFYFPWRFWGFAVPWKGSYEKETSAKCRAGICFILYVQRAGVVSQTLINILYVQRAGVVYKTLIKILYVQRTGVVSKTLRNILYVQRAGVVSKTLLNILYVQRAGVVSKTLINI